MHAPLLLAFLAGTAPQEALAWSAFGSRIALVEPAAALADDGAEGGETWAVVGSNEAVHRLSAKDLRVLRIHLDHELLGAQGTRYLLAGPGDEASGSRPVLLVDRAASSEERWVANVPDGHRLAWEFDSEGQLSTLRIPLQGRSEGPGLVLETWTTGATGVPEVQGVTEMAYDSSAAHPTGRASKGWFLLDGAPGHRVLLAGPGRILRLPFGSERCVDALFTSTVQEFDEARGVLFLSSVGLTRADGTGPPLRALDYSRGTELWTTRGERHDHRRPRYSEAFGSSLQLIDDLDGDGARELLVGDGGFLVSAVHVLSWRTGEVLITRSAAECSLDLRASQKVGLSHNHFGRRARRSGDGTILVGTFNRSAPRSEGVIAVLRPEGGCQVLREHDL